MANGNHPNTKLTDTQLVLLSAASQRDDGLLIPPASIKGPALAAALKALLNRGLIEEVGAESDQPGGSMHEKGRPVTGKITRAGFDALGITQRATKRPPRTARAGPRADARGRNGLRPEARHRPGRPRSGRSR